MLASGARVGYARDAGSDLHKGGVHAGVDLGYGVDLRAVDIAERIVAQQVVDGDDTQLLLQKFGSHLTYASDVFHAIIKPICHNTKI